MVDSAKHYGTVDFLDGIQNIMSIFEDPDAVFTTMAPNIKAEPIKNLMSKAIDELKESSLFAYHHSDRNSSEMILGQGR